jgi:outer membrane biosynthesis protein TonB
MERAERTGLGVSVAGHVALFALLSLGLVSTAKLPPFKTEPIDVQFVDEVGRQSAAPQNAEPPAPSKAPEVAKPEEPPPEPTPEPTPKPSPAPPKPAPQPTPKPEKAEEKPAPKPAKKPEKAVEKPTPKPVPKPEAKPTPKAAAPTDDRGRRRPDHQEEGAKPAPDKPGRKAAGARFDPNILKGLADAPGKAKAPKAATVSALQLTGLAAAIKRQVQPCYELGSLQGTPAMSIVTVLRLQFNKDGTVTGTPTVSEQTGVNGDNGAYTKQIADVARRAVLRCAPLHLPPDLYEGGWQDIELRFIPGQMG